MPHDNGQSAAEAIEYVIASTARSGRYHHNILTCLAAPMGARVQYRYDARKADDSEQAGGGLMDPAMLSSPSGLVGKKALVCHIDVDKLKEVAGDDGRAKINETFPVFPVREVNISRVLRAGSMLTLDLEIGRVPDLRESEGNDPLRAFRRDLAAFEGKMPQTADLDPKVARTKDGYLCFGVDPSFEVTTVPSSGASSLVGRAAAESEAYQGTTVEQGESVTAGKSVSPAIHLSTTLGAWESTVGALHTATSFRDVPYFFTVAGTVEAEMKEEIWLQRWPDSDSPFYVDEDYRIAFYIYHPSMDRHQIDDGHSLHLTASPGVQITKATDLVVDSPYDVRTAAFRIEARLVPNTFRLDREPNEWIQIGPRDPESATDHPLAEWSFQLGMPLGGYQKQLITRLLIVGIVLAIPTGLSLVDKVPGFVAFILAVLVGTVGAYANLIGIRRA